MNAHLKMDSPVEGDRLADMAQGVIGKPLDRPEGSLKVSGRATFANEYAVERLAHGVLVRATVTKGKVASVDAATVEAMDGVLAVITDERLLRNPAQGTANEAPVQGSSQVAYFGQAIALVVAETFEQARHAAQTLAIDFDIEHATVNPESEETKVESPDAFCQGDLEQAMKDAVHGIDVTYRTPGHNAAAMEPHASIAEWKGDNLTLRGSYQMLNYNRNELADSLGIDARHIRILSPYIGGGFGSKLGIAPEAVAAAIAAKELDRPVSVVMSRAQVFDTVVRRSESRQRIRLAADADGRLNGIGHESLVSNLDGESFAEPVGQATHFLYRGEHRVIGESVARVSRTCAGSIRAPGEAIGVVTLENAMDELARASGIDPVELRKRNIPESDPETDKPFSSHRFADCLDRGAETFDWAQRTKGGTREGEWLIGTGMASAVRINMLMESQARVKLGADATAIVETDMTDLGTGTYTILTQIAAEMLGLPVERVTTVLGDSDLPTSAGSGGCWGAASSGTSVFLACEGIRAQLSERVGCDERDLTLKDGAAIVANISTPLEKILGGDTLTQVGHIEPGKTGKKTRQATYGAYFAEVAVSSVTGETRVRRMHGAFSAGRILNSKTARSQCIGGMVWGIGMALTEELAHDPRDGHIVNRDLAEYHIAVNADVPQITVDLVEERDPWANPLQAKGIGELGICGAAASITNAIYDATGVRVRDYPVTLDKVIAGI